jgi:LPS export ABC transporter protein LptC
MRTIILAALAVALLAACRGATEPVDAYYETLPADQVLVDVEHAITSNGVRQSLLRSDTSLIFNDSAAIHLRGVNLHVYDPEGRLTATLTSRTGELNQNTNKMVARGEAGCMAQPEHRGCVVLVVEGPEGRTVWTEELHYDPSQKRIWSDVTTRSRTRGGEDMTGDSFTSDDQFRNFRITVPRGTGIRVGF